MPLLILAIILTVALGNIFCSCSPAEPEAPPANHKSGISISVDSMRNVTEDLYIQ